VRKVVWRATRSCVCVCVCVCVSQAACHFGIRLHCTVMCVSMCLAVSVSMCLCWCVGGVRTCLCVRGERVSLSACARVQGNLTYLSMDSGFSENTSLRRDSSADAHLDERSDVLSDADGRGSRTLRQLSRTPRNRVTAVCARHTHTRQTESAR
jgi:hypothetical protein